MDAKQYSNALREEELKNVVYINPPYAEAGDVRQRTGTGQNKTDVSVSHSVYDRYVGKIGLAGRELFALFLMRIFDEIPGCVVGQFSKLKHLQAPNFKAFREVFRGRIEKCFLAPADTFDNVRGKFPIGFFVWRLGNGVFTETTADVYDRMGECIGTKTIVAYDDVANIGKWVNSYRHDEGLHLGFMSNGRNDFQNQKLVYFINDRKQLSTPRGWWITEPNLLPMCIFVAVRHSIEATWLNDRDQFLYPDDGWEADVGFRMDCLVYSLLSDFNSIKSADGVNHWIPFTEEEVGAKDCFKSHFMSDFLRASASLRENLSPAAAAVLDAGRELWRYYHAQPGANPDASYYDIRLFFQGATTDAKGKSKMNSSSADATYTQLLAALRAAMKRLAAAIEPKVYEYGFLKK